MIDFDNYHETAYQASFDQPLMPIDDHAVSGKEIIRFLRIKESFPISVYYEKNKEDVFVTHWVHSGLGSYRTFQEFEFFPGYLPLPIVKTRKFQKIKLSEDKFYYDLGGSIMGPMGKHPTKKGKWISKDPDQYYGDEAYWGSNGFASCRKSPLEKNINDLVEEVPLYVSDHLND